MDNERAPKRMNGGLQRKVLRLCVGLIAGGIAVFTIIHVLQMQRLFLIMSQDQHDATASEACKAFFGRSVIYLIIAIIVIEAAAMLIAFIFSKKLSKPIDIMIRSLEEMDGDHMFFDTNEAYKTGDEIELLADAFCDLTNNLLDYIIENTRINREKQRIDTELATATRIQDSMLPKLFPPFPDRNEFELYAKMKPAKEVGGDFYDYFFMDDDNLVLVIGDVSGKGISAALFMVMTKHIMQNQVIRRDGDVVEAITDVNTLLMEENGAKMFVTVWLGVLNVPTGRLQYVNA